MCIRDSFTIESARSLAKQLQFGALPMSFSLQTENDISPVSYTHLDVYKRQPQDHTVPSPHRATE